MVHITRAVEKMNDEQRSTYTHTQFNILAPLRHRDTLSALFPHEKATLALNSRIIITPPFIYGLNKIFVLFLSARRI